MQFHDATVFFNAAQQASRQQGVISFSKDGGRTWARRLLMSDSYSGYSSMSAPVVPGTNTAGVLWEACSLPLPNRVQCLPGLFGEGTYNQIKFSTFDLPLDMFAGIGHQVPVAEQRTCTWGPGPADAFGSHYQCLHLDTQPAGLFPDLESCRHACCQDDQCSMYQFDSGQCYHSHRSWNIQSTYRSTAYLFARPHMHQERIMTRPW